MPVYADKGALFADNATGMAQWPFFRVTFQATLGIETMSAVGRTAKVVYLRLRSVEHFSREKLTRPFEAKAQANDS